ncbi:MAG: hypothetical protein WCJ30_08710 [Deltaproteobacteria bacterium]
MKPMLPEESFDLAKLTREMIDLAQRFLNGDATRDALVSWARVEGRSRAFRTATANDLHACVWNADVTKKKSKRDFRVLVEQRSPGSIDGHRAGPADHARRGHSGTDHSPILRGEAVLDPGYAFSSIRGSPGAAAARPHPAAARRGA